MTVAELDALTRIDGALSSLIRGPNSSRAHQRLARMTGVDLDRAGFFLLRRVSEEESVRLTDLAQRSGLDLSTVSRQAQQLERRGLVRRERDPADGRASVFFVTPEGRRVARRLRAARRTLLSEILAGWTNEERDRLAQLLGRFADDVTRHWAEE